ncbi:MAG: transcriptional regulator [Cyanobacteria bacterium P01_F01_bin.150]
MTLTRDFRETVHQRVETDSEFAVALLEEAIALFLNGEPETARLVLRDLVKATIGLDQLALEIETSNTHLHEMLAMNGNPSMENLTQIFNVLRKTLKVNIKVETITIA